MSNANMLSQGPRLRKRQRTARVNSIEYASGEEEHLPVSERTRKEYREEYFATEPKSDWEVLPVEPRGRVSGFNSRCGTGQQKYSPHNREPCAHDRYRGEKTGKRAQVTLRTNSKYPAHKYYYDGAIGERTYSTYSPGIAVISKKRRSSSSGSSTTLQPTLWVKAGRAYIDKPEKKPGSFLWSRDLFAVDCTGVSSTERAEEAIVSGVSQVTGRIGDGTFYRLRQDSQAELEAAVKSVDSQSETLSSPLSSLGRIPSTSPLAPPQSNKKIASGDSRTALQANRFNFRVTTSILSRPHDLFNMSRNRPSNRRQNRTGLVDHDVFEGIPVRHWRRDYVTVAPPAPVETTSQNDIFTVELPWGMPPNSHLLPQHSQDLLRAARSGRIYKRPAPAEEEETDAEAVPGDKPEKKEDDPKDKGFTAKAWKQIPRHAEGSAIEYLAKRRKGVITITKDIAIATVTKAKVKKVDAAGNEFVQDVIISVGQQVEGEVISQTVIPDPNVTLPPASAPVQATPPRKKGPAPKKKSKKSGPGRGRKGAKHSAAATSVPATNEIAAPNVAETAASGPVESADVKMENDTGAAPAVNEDSEMGDGSIVASDDDDDDDDEDGDENDGSVEGSPSKTSRPSSSPAPGSLPVINSVPDLNPADAMNGVDFSRPPLLQTRLSDSKTGSPLKNVALTTSTLTSPIDSAPSTSLSAPPPPPSQSSHVLEAPVQAAALTEVEATVSTELPPSPPAPIGADVACSVEVTKEHEEEEMLLDTLEEAAKASTRSASPIKSVTPEKAATPASTAHAQPEAILSPRPQSAASSSLSEPTKSVTPPNASSPKDLTPEESTPKEPSPGVLTPPVLRSATGLTTAPVQDEDDVDDDDDDDFPDLLGGLEKSLGKKKEDPPAASALRSMAEEAKKAKEDDDLLRGIGRGLKSNK